MQHSQPPVADYGDFGRAVRAFEGHGFNSVAASRHDVGPRGAVGLATKDVLTAVGRAGGAPPLLQNVPLPVANGPAEWLPRTLPLGISQTPTVCF